MNLNYDNSYAIDNVYGKSVALLRGILRTPGGIHLDIGCGFGRMAEIIRDEINARYIGVDIDADSLERLRERGFEAIFLDLRDPDAALGAIKEILPESVPIESISILDTLEHLSEPEKALQFIGGLTAENGCPVVASVPNFAHRDIAFRLLVGKLEYTISGLLDHTHKICFTDAGFDAFMKKQGFHEIARNDVVMKKSDQAFPRDLAPLAGGTPLNDFLTNIRGNSDEFSEVNQLVRMYVRSIPGIVPPLYDSSRPDSSLDMPFLTVVTRTQGERTVELKETLLCLMAQEDQDFNVLVVGHNLNLTGQLKVERVIADLPPCFQKKVSLIRVDGGGRARPLNEAFQKATGRYVAMLDDDDLVFGHWTKTFKELSAENPGKLLRTVCLTQEWKRIRDLNGQVKSTTATGPFVSQYPESFDLFDHLIDNHSPLHSLAFPRSLYTDLGIRFDEDRTTAEDWSFIIRVAPLAGVASSKEPTCIYRRWIDGGCSATAHDKEEWSYNYKSILRSMDSAPILLPTGSTRRLRNLIQENSMLKDEIRRLSNAPIRPELLCDENEARYVEALRWRLHELLTSRSWRYTRPLRKLRKLLSGDRNPGFESLQLWRLSPRDLEYVIAMIEGSRSFRITAPFRRQKS